MSTGWVFDMVWGEKNEAQDEHKPKSQRDELFSELKGQKK